MRVVQSSMMRVQGSMLCVQRFNDARSRFVYSKDRMFFCSIVLLFACSIVRMFNCSLVQLFNCSIARLFNCWVCLISQVKKENQGSTEDTEAHRVLLISIINFVKLSGFVPHRQAYCITLWQKKTCQNGLHFQIPKSQHFHIPKSINPRINTLPH